MTLNPGQTLAHYRIIDALGAGAMGEVYRARDTRLDREVAIKVLPDEFASDDERLRRFEREAKSLASLNHPNVAQIYGVDQVGDTCFLVLELVEGETLEARLKRGPLTQDETIDILRQIAAGLEAAHEAGVIHRDLKPANVRITPDGQVKVLDFGLAKPIGTGSDSRSSDSVLATEQGRLLGTPLYMAPEQARNRSIDRRVDVWAFGCVLFECLSGERPFVGDTLTDVLASVLRSEPDWKLLPATTPPRVRDLVRRCLTKDPRERLRDIGEARYALANAHVAEHASAVEALSPSWIKRTLLSALAAAVLSAFAFWAGRMRELPAAHVVRSSIQVPSEITLGGSSDAPLALSPDGRTLAFVGTRTGESVRLWIRALDSLTPQPLAGTDGAIDPFWSPDGRSIAFFANGKLKKIPAAGGSVTILCDAADPRGGTWGRDGTIVFTPTPFGPMYRVPATGGTPTATTKAAGQQSHRVPHFLPDGKRLLYVDESPDANVIMLLDLSSGVSTLVAKEPSTALYAAPDHMLFVRGAHLMMQPFDAASGKLGGEPVLIAENVLFNPVRMTGAFSVSDEGTLVYARRSMLKRLELRDVDGQIFTPVGEPARFRSIVLSPTGERVAATIERDDGKLDLWSYDTRRGFGTKLVEDVQPWGLVWSPDARRLTYSSESRTTVHVRSTEGSSDDVVLSDTENFCTDWSRDGKLLAFGRQVPTTGFDISLGPPDENSKLMVFRATKAEELGGLFSPDGHWLAYTSDESGRSELYVAPVPGPGAGRQATSTGTNTCLAWLDDGRIVYVDLPGQKLFAVDARPNGETIEIGTPKQLYEAVNPTGFSISISRDGKHLMIATPFGDDGSQSLTLVQNWPAAIAME